MTDRERVALEEEASSLPIHVRMCAFRHDAIMAEIREFREDTDRRLAELRSDADRRLGRIEKAAWGILATVGAGGLATLNQLAPLMQALAGQ